MQICYVMYLSATTHSNYYANLVQDHGPGLHDLDSHESGSWIGHWYAALNSDWSITFGFFQCCHISAGYVARQINIQFYGFSMSIHELGQSFQKWCIPLNCPRCLTTQEYYFGAIKLHLVKWWSSPEIKMNPMKFEQTLCNLHKSSEILTNPVQFKWTLWDLDKPHEIQTEPREISAWNSLCIKLNNTVYKSEKNCSGI